MKRYPFVKPFSLITGNYVYDVNKNCILKIKNKNTYQTILDMIKYGINDNVDNQEINVIRDKGFLKENNIEKIWNCQCIVCDSYIKSNVNKMILQVTQKCNLKCNYCPYAWDGHMERSHTDRSMSWETAKNAIDVLIENSVNSEELSLSFYGGEPLLEFGLIKKCVEYINEKVKSKKVTFRMTTNGTMLNNEILDFIEKYPFDVFISLDGPKDAHDKNRRFGATGKGTFDTIIDKVRLIVNSYPTLINSFHFNAVWDGSEKIQKIINFFETDEVASNFEYIIDHVDSSSIQYENSVTDVNRVQEQFKLFVLFSKLIQKQELGHLDRMTENKIEGLKNLIKQFDDKKSLYPIRFQSGPCIPGCAKMFVDIYGNVYPCEKSSDRSLIFGNVNSDKIFNINAAKNLMNLYGISQASCSKCWAFRFCKLCAVFASNKENMSLDILTTECNFNNQQLFNSFKELVYLYELGITKEIILNI